MGASRYIQALWTKKQSDVLRYLMRIRTWEYRQLPSVHRVQAPTRIDKAHRMGWKAKQGYAIFRVRIRRGDRKKRVRKGIVYGKPAHHGVHKQKSACSLQVLAEKRVGHAVPGMRLLNSYWVGQDGMSKFYECIMVDPGHCVIRNDPKINWICKARAKHRETHGTTSAGRKSRGLLNKGVGAAKLRPSIRADWKRRNRISLRRYR